MANQKKQLKGGKVFENNAKKVSIRALNESISAQLSSARVDEEGNKIFLDDKEICLNKYESCKEKGVPVNVRFDACDKDGNFSCYEDGVLLLLPGDNVSAVQGVMDGYTTARMLGIEFSLKVVEVDRENARVYCEIPGATKRLAQQTIKDALQKELNKLVSQGKRPLVYGSIIRVENRRALVNILGQGVLGFIDVSHWQKCYTRSMIGMCEVGEYFQFEVLKKAYKSDGRKDKGDAWILDRSRITEDAWSLIDQSSLQEGGSILVTCIEKPEGKTYWWGKSDRVPGIEVMGDFTEKINPNTILIEGITYRCWIKEIHIDKTDHKKNIFKVIPAEVVKEDVAKVESFKKLRSTKDTQE